METEANLEVLGKTGLGRQFWIAGTDTKRYEADARQLTRMQLGKEAEDLLIVNIQVDEITGRVTGQLFAFGNFPKEIAEGVDKWVPTTKEAIQEMVNSGLKYELKKVAAHPDEINATAFDLLKKILGNTDATRVVTSIEWVKIKVLLGGPSAAAERYHVIDPADVSEIQRLASNLEADTIEGVGPEDQLKWATILRKVLQKDGW